MRQVARRFNLGKRSQVLAVFGVIWAFLGLATMFTEPTGIGKLYPHAVVPAEIRGLVWLACGLVAAVVGLSRTRRDAWGFTALSVMPMVHFISGVWVALMWLVPGGPPGHVLSLTVVAVWGAFVQLMTILADWPNPLKVPDEQ